YKFIEGTTRKQAVVLNDRVKQVSGTLIIKDAVVEDSGKYLCVVNNSVGGESVETVLTVTAPLSAKIDPPTQTIDFGRPAVFTCQYTGNPIKTVSWMKDGKAMGHSEPVLRIESVKKEDKGMYQCFVRNDQESAEASAELKLGGRFDPPVIRQAFQEETMEPGPSVFLKCVAGGNPTPEISWELDGKKIANNERYQVGQYVTVNGDVVSYLNITSVHANDGGLYKCIAKSKVGVAEHSAKLNVYGLPYIRQMEKKAIVAGETLMVTCPVAGYPIDSIVWERDNRALPINRKQKVFPNGTLIIENVERNSDQATYTCVAKNQEGYSARGSLEVQVMVPPQIAHFDFGEETINMNDMVSATCTVNKGDTPLELYWTTAPQPELGVAKLMSNDGILITKTTQRISMLSIESVHARHRANYTCVARNAAGSVYHTAELRVNVLPQIMPFDFGADSINEQDMVSAYCTVNKGDLPLDIAWTKNGGRVFTNDGVVVTRTSQRISVFSIESVRARHAGNYSCVATNNAGVTRQSALLAVNVPPSLAPFSFGDEPVNTGENAGVQCMVQKGDVPITIKWTLNSRPIVNGEEGITILKLSPKTSVLNIAAVEQYHSGLFKCIAENLAGSSYTSSELKVNVKPHVLPFSFGSEIFNMGDVLSINCVVLKGDLPLAINWTLNDQLIVDGQQGFTVMQLNSRTSYMSVDSLQAKHRGVYSCIAQNLAGQAKYSAELQVNVAPQISPFSFGDEPLNRGEVASLTCVVPKGDLPLDIYWTLNSALIVNGELGFTLVRLNKRTSSLNVDSLEAVHRGSYKCIANNSAGFAEHVAVLEVNVLPQIQSFDFGLEIANTGDMAGVNCMVTKGDLPMEIRWTLNAAPIITGEHGFSLTRLNPRTSSLSIDSLEAHHRGNYKCIATNKAGSAEYSAELHVNVPPQVLPFSFGEAAADVGDIASANCVVPKGDLPLEIRWSLNSAPIINGEHGFSVLRLNKRTSSLNIDSLAAFHRGVYKCIASNQAGSSEYVAELQVNVPPQVMPFIFGDEPSNYGDSTAVQCMVFKGDTPLQLHWTLNGQPITNGNAGIRIIKMSPKLSSLSIDSINGHHRVPPQIRPFDFGDEASNSGETLGIQCTIIKGDLPINISWALNNQTLTSGDWDVAIGRLSSKSSTLNIDYIAAEHRVPPQIVPFAYDDVINVGDSIDLFCQLQKGDRPVRIHWSFERSSNEASDASLLQLQQQPQMRTNRISGKTSMLSIASASPAHTGLYSCIASNVAGTVSYDVNLTVNVAPKIAPFEFGEEPLNYGEPASVQCTILGGDLPINVTWLLNNATIDSYHDISYSRIGKRIKVLSIEAVAAHHAGSYSCHAQNKAGLTAHTARLIVNVPPKITPFSFGSEPMNFGEPVSVHCTISGGDLPVSVIWTLNRHPLLPELQIFTEKRGQR
ncbi:Dscam, partial [Drosophila busckii]